MVCLTTVELAVLTVLTLEVLLFIDAVPALLGEVRFVSAVEGGVALRCGAVEATLRRTDVGVDLGVEDTTLVFVLVVLATIGAIGFPVPVFADCSLLFLSAFGAGTVRAILL